ncbi:MAG: ATPase, T2SS/T4P/T4SS family, partial [Vicinamibacterales bacterium]
VVSLLRAIDRADGEALVMHVGEKPYVVTASGHAELASNALTVSAMTGMLDQLLPADSRHALNELGAVEYHLPPDEAAPGTRYSVVAARGGDDIWIEVRRRKEVEEPVHVAMGHGSVAVEEPPSPVPQQPPMARLEEYAPPPVIEEPEPIAIDEEREPAPLAEPESVAHPEPEPVAYQEPEPPIVEEAAPAVAAPVAEPAVAETPGEKFELKTQTDEDFYVPNPVDEVMADEPAPLDEPAPALDFTVEPEPVFVPSVVVPMPARPESPRVISVPKPPAHGEPLHHLLKVAAVQGASALYVAPQAKPSLRVDGEMRVLDDAPMTDAQLESGLRSLAAPGTDGAPLPLGEFETRELVGVGRVQCLVFRDHRGLGAIFRMLPGRTVSAEQAGLSAGIQSLCTEPEGLLLVAGAPGAGKSTLVAALVDQINRTRRDHVITIETDIQFVHENRTSFVSQREAREDGTFMEAVRAGMREGPDVLVIDGVMNPEVASAALHAAANGLVVASVTAPATSAALERFVSFFGNDAASARAMVGEHLRGVVTQALLRKTGGGRAAAREVLVNVPSVASLVANAQFDQLPGVLNSGRRVGMVPLNDALLGLVQSGALDVRQAFRKSPDQNELVGMLNQAGFDTTFAERLS